MKVKLWPADNGGCGHYRIRMPAAALAQTETTVDVEVLDHEHGIPLKKGSSGRIEQSEPLDCDVFVIQRPLYWWAAQAIPVWQQQGVRVVVELDDDFSCLHPRNGAYYGYHPAHSRLVNWNHLRSACAAADFVTVSTPALAERYGRRGRVAVLRNYVPESRLEIPHAGDGKTVGWAGVVGSHPDDLQVTHGGVNQALGETGARFLCIGNGELVAEYLGLLFEPEITGYVEGLDNYARELARLDVGIVPLADTRFNAAKSWLKGLEYAAAGVPFVASDVAEYGQLNEGYGLGQLATPRARDWKRRVAELIRRPDLARAIGDQARDVVREDLTIEKNAWRWAEAWEEAMACVS